MALRRQSKAGACALLRPQKLSCYLDRNPWRGQGWRAGGKPRGLILVTCMTHHTLPALKLGTHTHTQVTRQDCNQAQETGRAAENSRAAGNSGPAARRWVGEGRRGQVPDARPSVLPCSGIRTTRLAPLLWKEAQTPYLGLFSELQPRGTGTEQTPRPPTCYGCRKRLQKEAADLLLYLPSPRGRRCRPQQLPSGVLLPQPHPHPSG